MFTFLLFFWGALANGIYYFLLFDTIKITGGSIAYGAFMMTSDISYIRKKNNYIF
jgi:hypothetical protein